MAKLFFIFLLFSCFLTKSYTQDMPTLQQFAQLAQGQTMTGPALVPPTAPSIPTQNEPLNNEDSIIFRFSPGDTLVLDFLLIEDFFNNQDLSLNLQNEQEDLQNEDLQNEQEALTEIEGGNINQSFGPMAMLRLEQISRGFLTPTKREYLLQLKSQFEASNPFTLDARGYLNLPGLASVMISGLTVDEASYRLRSEESLDGFIVGVTAMPIDGNTRNNLELFGVNLFNNQTSSQSDYFSTQSLPDLYQIGVGDRVLVQLYGSQNRSEILTVNNEGAINIFGIGPIHIIGVSNQNLNSYIDGQISGLMVGTKVNATVVSSRPIEVFIIGAVNSPGSVLVSAFSTLTDALIAAEGIVNQASLRNIVVIRNGEEINIDLYDFIISGDSSADPRLLQGDTILVNLADTLVGVFGQVRRESIYEVIPGTTSADLIEMAGGVNGIADINSSVIERLGGNGVAQSIALSMISEGGFQDGDFIRIPTISSTLADSVTIVGGHVSEGINPWREGDRLLDVIGPRESLTGNVDMSYILIRRQPLVGGDIEYLMANLSVAFDDPDSSDNLFLEDRDTIYLFTASVRRSSIINPLVTELRYISSINTSSTDIDNVVSMSGHVYFPSEYPLTNMMTLSDLIAASGGTRDGVDLFSFSILRLKNEGSIQNQEIISIDDYQNTEYRLMPGDTVSVLPLSNWGAPKSIELLGEVQRPGMYMIKDGESLGNVIDRAGGFTQEAFLSGVFYQREVLMEREMSTKELLLLQIQAQLTSVAVASDDAMQAMVFTQNILNQYAAQVPLGRLSFSNINSYEDQIRSVVAMDQDVIYVPEQPSSVSVFGEVRVPSSHFYSAGRTIEDYINLAGSYSATADSRGVIVIKSDGSVVPMPQRRLLFNREIQVEAGDTILVPPDLNVNLQRNLSLATNITQIIYQMAVAAAAVHSF